jgi:hypothetical protein
MKRWTTLIALLVSVTLATAQTMPTSQWQHIKNNTHRFAVELNAHNTHIAKAATQQMKLDSMNVNVFGFTIKEQFVYDGLGRLIEMVAVGPDSLGTLVNEGKVELSYDAIGRLSLVANFSWDVASSSWKPDERATYSYTASHAIDDIVWQWWDAGNATWQNAEKFMYTYNSQNQMLTETLLEWFSSGWQNWENWINGYSGNLKTSLVRQFWTGSNWMDADSTFFAFDGSSQLIEELDFIWLGTVWDKSEKTTYHYIMSAKQDSSIVYSWDQMNLYWMPMDMKFTTYDANGDFDEIISFTFDSYDSLWIANTRESFDYDVNYSFADLVLPTFAFEAEVPINQMFSHKLDKDIIEIGTAGNWYPFGEVDFHYSLFTPFGLPDYSAGARVVYPNPIADWLTIALPEPNAIYTFELYTASGQLLLTSAVQGKTMINTSALPHGLYVWQLHPGSGKKENGVRGKLVK